LRLRYKRRVAVQQLKFLREVYLVLLVELVEVLVLDQSLEGKGLLSGVGLFEQTSQLFHGSYPTHEQRVVERRSAVDIVVGEL